MARHKGQHYNPEERSVPLFAWLGDPSNFRRQVCRVCKADTNEVRGIVVVVVSSFKFIKPMCKRKKHGTPNLNNYCFAIALALQGRWLAFGFIWG